MSMNPTQPGEAATPRTRPHLPPQPIEVDFKTLLAYAADLESYCSALESEHKAALAEAATQASAGGDSRDTERTDWCEAHNAFPEYDDNGFWKARYCGRWFTGNTARQAIDAAMRPAQPEQKGEAPQ